MNRRHATSGTALGAKSCGQSAEGSAAEAKPANAWVQLPPCGQVDFTDMEAVTGYARQLADYLNEIGGYTPGDIPSPAMRRFRHEATTWLRNVENITFPRCTDSTGASSCNRGAVTNRISPLQTGDTQRARQCPVPPELLDAYDILHRILRATPPIDL